MITNEELHLAKIASFEVELEKLGAPLLGSILKMFPKLSKGLTNVASKASKPVMPKIIKSVPGGRKSVIDEAIGSGWVNKKFNAEGPRTMFGTKTKIHDVVDLGKAKPKFFSNPIQATKNAVGNVIKNQASNIEHISKKGLIDFTKQEFKNTKYFTREVTRNGRTYGVRMERSRLGRVASPLLGTGAGFGAFELATNAKDPEGNKQSLLKRVGQAAGTTLKWGVGAPVMGAKLLAYDMPKEVYNATQGFK